MSQGPVATQEAGDYVGKQLWRYLKAKPFYQPVVGGKVRRYWNYAMQWFWGVLGLVAPFLLVFLPVNAKAAGDSDMVVVLWMIPLVALGLFTSICAGLSTSAMQEQNPKVHFFVKSFAVVAPVALVLAAFFGFELELPDL